MDLTLGCDSQAGIAAGSVMTAKLTFILLSLHRENLTSKVGKLLWPVLFNAIEEDL